jgi:hypothetical protein
MPSSIIIAQHDCVAGIAVHPRYPQYGCTVHLVQHGTIMVSAMAGQPMEPGLPNFMLSVPGRLFRKRLGVLVAETGELLKVSVEPQNPSAVLRIEDLLQTPPDLSWITGECYLDAKAAGFDHLEIIELITRDLLGRTPDSQLLIEAIQTVRRKQGFDIYRLQLLTSIEYVSKTRSALNPPGSLFSDFTVKDVMRRRASLARQKPVKIVEFDMDSLVKLPPAEFVRECFLLMFGTYPTPDEFQDISSKSRESRSYGDLIELIAAEHGTRQR